MAKHIDMASYPRKAHFDYFRTLANPYMGVTVETDVTDAVAACRNKDRSFFLSVLHCAALAADDIPEFRQRIDGSGIIEYDECPTSHIELLENGSYCYCTLYHHMDIEEYYKDARKRQAAAKKAATIEEDENVDSMYFISCIPSLSYSALVQPTGSDSNPRITWGGYREVNGRLIMPVSVLVHHSLMDGMQLTEFYRGLEARMSKL